MESGYMSESGHWIVTYKRKAYKKARYKRAARRALFWFTQMCIDGKITITTESFAKDINVRSK